MTTTNSREEAERIASELVKQQLAACVQVGGPITSTYRWKGAVERSDEWKCVAKSRADQFDQVTAAIQKLHSYEVPEIIGVPISAISPSYLSWLESEK